MNFRISMALAIGLFGLAAAAPLANAVDNFSPPPPTQPATTQTPANPATTQAPANPPTTPTQQEQPKPGNNAQPPKKSSKLFLQNYRAAHALIYRRHDFQGGIAKLKSLGHDDHPDVANLIGYSSRKLGRYDDAKHWYEKALVSDPNHARTWSYYGMWHAEQGNLLKAREHLAKVQSICGTRCRAYAELKGVIEGTRLY
jgi:tetratricopeptide (TPR) repeat protein